MWSHLSKTKTNKHALWYKKPPDLEKFFQGFIVHHTFNLHEIVPENDFKFFIDFDYKNTNEYLPNDVIIYIRHLLDTFIGSQSLLAINKHDGKTGLHFVYPEKIVSREEAKQLATKITEQHPEFKDYVDTAPYKGKLRTIYSIKCVGEEDFYVPCDGKRDAQTMVRYSIFRAQEEN